MFDMLATTRVLTEAGFDARQAQAITAVVQQATADRGGDYVTREYLDERLDQLEQRFDERLDAAVDKLRAEFQAEIARSEVRIIRWVVGAVFAAVGLAVAVVRLLG